jgi:hypothetical protein
MTSRPIVILAAARSRNVCKKCSKSFRFSNVVPVSHLNWFNEAVLNPPQKPK